jgi:hypothetical protein
MEMKSTAERLGGSYCFPDESNFERFRSETDRYPFLTTASDELLYWHGPCRYYYHGGSQREGSEEVSVDVFCDLYNDRIVPWRLIEDGFAHVSTQPPPNAPRDAKLYSYNGCVFVAMSGGAVWVMYYTDEMKGTHTYTDLLNLIRLIG